MTKRKRYKKPAIDSLRRWPVRPVPKPDESARGYFIRFAQQYRCFASSMAWAVGLVHAKLKAYFPCDIERISIVAGLTPEETDRLFVRHLDTHHGFRTSSFLGHRFFKSEILETGRRVCPMCLAEAPYDRAVWGLRSYSVCSTPRVELIDRCPKCHDKLNWHMKVITACKCGHDLRTANENLVCRTQADIDELAGTLMSDILTGNADYLPPGLRDIPPQDFCIAMMSIRNRFKPPSGKPSFSAVRVWEGLRDLQHDRSRLISELAGVVEGAYRYSSRQTQIGAMVALSTSLHQDRVGAEIRSVIDEALNIGKVRRAAMQARKTKN